MSDKKVTLLKSLMKCFSASKSDICYVVKNGNKYCMPPENVVEWWKLLYCKNIVALSIAPQSHNRQLSQDALSAFVRKVVNDKNKNIVETNLNPRLMRSSKCTELIIEEIEHLGETIELGVRAKHSPCDKYTHEIRENELKSLTDVKIFMDEAIEFLEHLFFATPFGIIKQENSWFVNSIPKLEKEKGEHYTKEQVLMMLACALILGLNVNDLPQINSNIKEFIVSTFSDKGKGTADAIPNKEKSQGKPTEECKSEINTPIVSFDFSKSKDLAYLRKVERAKRIMTDLNEALELMKEATSVNDFQKARFQIVRAIEKCPSYAEIILATYSDEEEGELLENGWDVISDKLKRKLILLIEHYNALVEKDLSEIGEIDSDLALIKLDFLLYLQDWHLTVAFLEETLKREQEGLRLAESQIQKEYLQRTIRYTESRLEYSHKGDKEDDMKIDDRVDAYRLSVANNITSV